MSVLDQKTFVSAIAPFNRLSPQELDFVVNAMDIAYYRKDERLINRNSVRILCSLLSKGLCKNQTMKA
ncbi:MAG: hypothetical protein R3E08_01010 [Thiotrichaceae bacterium]